MRHVKANESLLADRIVAKQFLEEHYPTGLAAPLAEFK